MRPDREVFAMAAANPVPFEKFSVHHQRTHRPTTVAMTQRLVVFSKRQPGECHKESGVGG